jgi:dihydrofolate reductase
MRKVILAMQMTLDGLIEGPKGELDWAAKEDVEAWQDHFDLMQSADTLLLGRVLYPGFEKYWLAAPTNPSSKKNEIEYARLADRIQKIVFSRTLEKVEWKTTRIAKDHITEEIQRMKQQPGKEDMVLLGGAGLASTFVNLGLIDEYHLIVNPFILGGGKPLSKDVKEHHNLKLINSKTFKSGKVVLHYGKAQV